MSLMAPTSSLVMVIPGGFPVMVGGPPTIDLMGMIFAMGLKGIGKLAKKGKGLLKKTKSFQRIGDSLQSAINRIKNKYPRIGKILQSFKCKHFGEPIDAATGRVYAENDDFNLPGPIPFTWTRYYYSDSEQPSPIGSNWHHSYHIGYHKASDDAIVLLRHDGREVALPSLTDGDLYFDPSEKISWFKDKRGVGFKDDNGLTHRFTTFSYDGYHPIETIENDLGFSIQFSYDKHGTLNEIIDSAGRILTVESKNQRITGISTHNLDGRVDLIRYEIDDQDNLVKVTDAHDVSKHFYYDGHLLVRLTNQTGLNFYWEYEGKGDNARCVHTWGDGGILEYWTQYEPGKTMATNALGHTTTYYYDKDNLIYRITDAKGGETYQEYDGDQNLMLIMDPAGNTTKYTYDKFGNTLSIQDADGHTSWMQYDGEQRLISYYSPGGQSMDWVYDAQGKLIRRDNADGSWNTFEYEDGKLTTITDHEDRVTRLAWNDRFDLRSVILPDGKKSSWQYDHLGHVLRSVQPNGATTTYQYDKVDNVLEVREPDGNKHFFEYDNAGNVTRAEDNQRQVEFTYWGLGNLKTRTENGKTLYFGYNKEEQLVGIVNEKGEAYKFGLDPLGQITAEWGFDGLQKRYVRDKAGRVTKVLRPDERWTRYQYTGTGKILAASYYDATTEYFNYDPDGRLIEATNEFATVMMSYDRGRLVSETQNEHAVNSQYNTFGQRTKITSSLGADIRHDFDENGELTRTATDDWEARFERDSLGLEIKRMVSGGLDISTDRDQKGRVIRHEIRSKNIEGRSVRYNWGRGDRLLSMVDELKGKKTTFGYNETGDLQFAQYGRGWETVYKMPDAVGNLFKSKDQNDREYDDGGKLVKDENHHYEYDAEGNLTKKTSLEGDWLYQWYGNGMLKSVQRPDNKKVQFEYDALGRRTAKISDGNITKFVWDGNTPLHEWTYSEQDRPTTYIDPQGTLQTEGTEPTTDMTTWLFEAGSFVPAAKIINDKKYSIVCDYLGTPVQAYDSSGEKVWECALDIYDKAMTVEGEASFVPFRYQGQYEDVETGLYYNRFRYYSPETGTYISKDPIGLAGNNPNMYAYTKDSNVWIDVFGLDCNSLGQWGEDFAKEQLEGNGKYKRVFSVQNGSNHGIDLVGERMDGKFDFFEVKTTGVGKAVPLSERQMNPDFFIRDILNKPNIESFGISEEAAATMLNNIGDKRVIDVFIDNGKLGNVLTSIWGG